MAASSPLALGSVLVVLTSGRGRLNGAAFAIGFVAGQAAFYLVAFFSLKTFTFPSHDNHPTLIAFLMIAFGASLVATALHVRRHRGEPPRARGPNRWVEAIRSRLSHLRPLTALETGAVLGVGGPKRLSITIVATATITAADVTSGAAFGLGLLYVAVATMLVWVPALLYIVWGPRAAEWLTRVQRWIGQHKDPLTIYPSAVLGLAFMIDGIVQLVR